MKVQNDLLQQRAVAAGIEADFSKGKMQAEMNEALAQNGLVAALQLCQSQVDLQQLGVRNQIAQVLVLTRRQRDDLKVRTGIDGVLQLVLGWSESR